MGVRTSRSPRRGGDVGGLLNGARLTEEVRQRDDTIALLQESIADLERSMMADGGWRRLAANAAREFSPEGLHQIREVCRVMAIAHPLVKRGLALKAAYVFGQGVEVSALADGNDEGEQDVNAVVQQFLDDPGNARVLTGAPAREQLEHALGTDGEFYLTLFTKPSTGRVQARVIVADQVANIISNPDDVSEPWFYHRRWTENRLDLASGQQMPTAQEAYHPAVGYRPRSMPRTIGGVAVRWDAPVLHVAVNVPLGWSRGIPDCYSAVDWARAYKEFLEDWARLMRSLARFAWKATTPGTKATAVKARIAQSPTRGVAGEPNQAGATVTLPPDVALEAISKSGATLDSESGRPLAMMVASALGVPVTMLLSDPGQTGARATAETLDQPTTLGMRQRQALWAQSDRTVLGYIIRESVRAPKGALKGTITRDEFDREVVTLDGDTPDTIDITWPDLEKISPELLVQAIVNADSTRTVPPELILRLLLNALGSRQVDEVIDAMLDEEGNFKWPAAPPLSPGQLAADAMRSGQDPAATGTGSMTPDEQPANTGNQGANGDQSGQ